MLAGAVILTDASIVGLPLLIPLTPEPVFAVEATRTPVRAQSFTTPDTVTGTVMVRGLGCDTSCRRSLPGRNDRQRCLRIAGSSLRSS
ncbi:hypothetical protein LOK55_13400, partial [Microbacterium sp. F2E]|uniref:hypothetical protein n=1 Tax=Microbacterium sp. F2E TaxID=2895284 RepID=UPI001E5AFE44